MNRAYFSNVYYAKCCNVRAATVERWKVDNNKGMIQACGYNDKMTTSHECVDSLKCLWCIKYKDRLIDLQSKCIVKIINM